MGLLFTYLIIRKVHILSLYTLDQKKSKTFCLLLGSQKTTTKAENVVFFKSCCFSTNSTKLDRSILSVPVCACVPNLDLYNGNTISEINSNIFAIGVVGKQLPSQSKVVTMCAEFLSCEISQGLLQRWTEHSTLIFENLKPVEISKNIFNNIWTSLKVV